MPSHPSQISGSNIRRNNTRTLRTIGCICVRRQRHHIVRHGHAQETTGHSSRQVGLQHAARARRGPRQRRLFPHLCGRPQLWFSEVLPRRVSNLEIEALDAGPWRGNSGGVGLYFLFFRPANTLTRLLRIVCGFQQSRRCTIQPFVYEKKNNGAATDRKFQ